MNKIYIANILLTRRCNLSCSYCNIVRNYNDMPEQYPKMCHYRKNELTSSQWINIISRILLNNPDCFFIFYGGEPTLFDPLQDILKFCNDEDVNYTVISNNTPYARDKIYEIYNNIGTLRGFTSSVDPVLFMKRKEDDISFKSRSGLENLSRMKEEGIADDVVAEITVTKDSVPYLERVISQLTRKGIFSSITAIDDQKTKYYDFSNTSACCLLEKNDDIRVIFDILKEKANRGELMIHIPDMLDELYDSLPSVMKCDLPEDVHNVTIEPDGSFRLCLRIRGTATPLVTDMIDTNGKMTQEFIDSIKYDYNSHCKGCNWTCVMMTSKRFRNQIINHNNIA